MRRLCGIILIAGSVLVACRATNRRPGDLRGVVLPAPLAKPDFTLTGTDGKPFDFRKGTDGYTTIVFFGYTHCPDVCPLQMATLGAVMPTLPPDVAARIRVVFITTDPRRDTPQRLKSWLDNFDPDFVGLTGDSATIARAEQAMNLPPSIVQPHAPGDTSYTVGHSAVVVTFTPDNLSHIVYATGTRQEDWAHDLPLLVRGPWSSH